MCIPQKGDVLSIKADLSYYYMPNFNPKDRWLVILSWHTEASVDSYNDYVPGENMLLIKKLYRDCRYNPNGKEIEISYDYTYQRGLKKDEVQIVGKMQERWELV